jgi:glutathione S-transferase
MDQNLEIVLITNKMCPYAQRVHLMLELSNPRLNFSLKEINLYGENGKPDWFMKLNPVGLVPVLYFPQTELVITESLDIVIYLLKNFPNSYSYLDQDIQTNWIDFLKKNLIYCDLQLDEITTALEKIEKKMNNNEGNYLGGSLMGLSDILYFPMLFRVNEAILKFDNNNLYPKLSKWLSLMLDNESIVKTIVHPWWWW